MVFPAGTGAAGVQDGPPSAASRRPSTQLELASLDSPKQSLKSGLSTGRGGWSEMEVYVLLMKNMGKCL